MVRQFLAKLADLDEAKATKLDFYGRPALVYRNGDRVFAAIDACSHAGGPLELQDDKLVCQWHGACFGRERGEAECAPAPTGTRLTRIPIRVEEGSVYYVYGE